MMKGMSGERREGTFIAVTTFTGMAVAGFGNVIGGVLLDLIDFPQGQMDAAVGNAPEETVMLLGTITEPGLIVFHLGAI